MLEVKRSRLLLLFLFSSSNGMDGCQGEDGKDYWRCGDVCTNAFDNTRYGGSSIRQDCHCGNETFGHADGKWCCGNNCTGGCLRWKEGFKNGDFPGNCLEWLPAKCTNGVALQLNQSCQGNCNYFGGDENRNYLSSRSYVAACANTSTCVKEGEGATIYRSYRPTICTGNSSCEGELAWCKEEGRRKEKCPFGSVRCPRNGANSIPGQCIHRSKLSDRKESCLDRSEKDRFQEAANATEKETIIDFASLKNCTSERELITSERNEAGTFTVHTTILHILGLKCGKQESSPCIHMKFWCKDEYSQACPVLGEGIRTNDPKLCANNSFWGKQRCGKLEDGEDMIRCQGGKRGQCVASKHWGVEGAKDYHGFEASCKDGGDKYRPIKQEEPSKAHHNKNSNNEEDDHFGGFTRAEASSSQNAQPQVWMTQPTADEFYNKYIKGSEEEGKHMKDPSTGLWMIPVKDEKTCVANKGFVCKVSLHAINYVILMAIIMLSN